MLDQQYDWSGRLAAASPAAALAIRGPIIDGDALAVANVLAANDSPNSLAPELLAFVQGHGATGVAHRSTRRPSSGRAGVALQPTIASMTNDPALSTPRAGDAVNDDGLRCSRTCRRSWHRPPGRRG